MKALLETNLASAAQPLELLDVATSTNTYSANGWSYECAEKYLFRMGKKLIEAGFYTHFADASMEMVVKQVIELPTSYGCPMKCAYCAASCIKGIMVLPPESLFEMTDLIIHAHALPADCKILVTLTGTGDAYYTLNQIERYIAVTSQRYRNASFTISSCAWTDSMLKRVEKMAAAHRFRNIQATFISMNDMVTRRLIPGLPHESCGIFEFINHIRTSLLRNWRINYVLLNAINDSNRSFRAFMEAMLPIKDKVIVRISSLNETLASKKSNLKPSSGDHAAVLQELLIAKGIHAYLFHSAHNDNMSCGQLVLERTLMESSDLFCQLSSPMKETAQILQSPSTDT